MTDSTYVTWLEANRTDLQDMWSSMGIVERHEEGGDFATFCKEQYGKRPMQSAETILDADAANAAADAGIANADAHANEEFKRIALE